MDKDVQVQPLVSFLIPTYNRASFLENCLDSISSQAYKNIEIIVIDDGSTDGTESLINSRFRTVKFYRNKINCGVSYSRNLGLGYARGEYIGLLDSDDVLLAKDHVENAVKILEEDPRISMVASDVYCLDLKGNKIGEKTFFQTVIDHRDADLSSGIKDFEYVFCHGIHSCGAIFRKDVTQEIGFLNTDYKISWDEDFFLRLSASDKFSIYYQNAPLAGYRIHNNSFSRNLPELYREKIRARYEIVKSNKDLKQRLGGKFNSRISEQYYCLSHAYVKENKLILSFFAALKATIIYPPVIFIFIKKILNRGDKGLS
ncbi:MAG: glycosyltransferase [Candidatus Omnitrophica bacterium]|nr:glycosyltransferase [Candidatus Omnitrophota bacterium]